MSDYYFLVCPDCGSMYDEKQVVDYNLNLVAESQGGVDVLKDNMLLCLNCGHSTPLESWARMPHR